MKKENFVVATENVEVVDGKLVISSEELAAAFQSQELDLNAEESAEDFNLCIVIHKK